MSDVFFTDMHTEFGNSIENKFKKILKRANLKDFIKDNELVALKVHVGERQNLAYINHNYARLVADEVKAAGGKPFLTDTNTLYTGGRNNGVDHAITAVQHGFTYASVGAPFIPADGVRSVDYAPFKIDGKHFKEAKLAAGILRADKVIFLTHVKGHIECGIGGTLKNLAMGCASVAGKQEQHSSSKPKIEAENCTGCRQCYAVCPTGAISMVDNIATIDYEVCIGCGQCVAACNFGAAQAMWDVEESDYLEKVSEYAWAAATALENKAFYLSFAINITADCDCFPINDVPIVEDVGIFGSYHPLAIERASVDMISKSPPVSTSSHRDKIKNEQNVFHEIREHVPSDTLFTYSKKLGMDDRYNLVTIT
jgi:uncharacterized Fe-S center protein